MTKFLQKSKYVIAVFLAILLASPFVLAGCGGTQITALSISLENSVSTVKVNETYRVEVLSNAGESVPDATLEL